MISLTTPQAQANLANANVAGIGAALGLHSCGDAGLAQVTSEWNCRADSFSRIDTDSSWYRDRLTLEATFEPKLGFGLEPEQPTPERRHPMIAVNRIDTVMPQLTQTRPQYTRSLRFRSSLAA